MAEVDAFGTLHVDRLSKVTDELNEFADDADVLFVEGPREEPDDSDELGMLLRNPALYFTGIILDWFWGILGFLLTRQFKPVDGVATETVALRKDLDIKPVDLNLPRRASEVSLIITALSWLWFVIAAVIFVLGVLASSIGVLIFAIAVGFLPVVPFAYWTLSERDEVMAENIEEILSSNDELNSGCLVAGRGHIDGVVEELEESDVEVSQVHKSKWLRRTL
ncbi:hypothetical protein [Halosimplex marinum]|uniref:hypothetical protein n=1 Tax=Halosimplex marinum TaxID=3396620 RepID=UPI003F554510